MIFIYTELANAWGNYDDYVALLNIEYQNMLLNIILYCTLLILTCCGTLYYKMMIYKTVFN